MRRVREVRLAGLGVVLPGVIEVPRPFQWARNGACALSAVFAVSTLAHGTGYERPHFAHIY